MYKKVMLIISITLITCCIIKAQAATSVKDSVIIKPESQSGNKKNGKSLEIKNNGNVKQVRSARPDMSRINGARPPSIVRPSGSGIPRGVGRPGGAKGAGRR